MPLPEPKKSEGKEKFMKRCLSDESMNQEYPDSKQRYAVCLTQWNERSKDTMDEKQTKFIDVAINDAVTDRDDKKRKMTVIVSNEIENRYGHVVKVKGWDYKNYMKSPIVLVNHNADALPVAKATRVWKNNKKNALMANIQFLDEGVSPEADLVWALYDNGFMTSVSPGYLVDYDKATYGKSEKEPKVTFNGQELLEISLANIPANPEAIRTNSMVQECLELGVIDENLIDKLEETMKKADDETDEIDAETDQTDTNEEDSVENTEQITNLDIVQECIDATPDPYKWFFDEYKPIKDQIDSRNKLVEQIIESDESLEDSNIDSTDDIVDEILSKYSK